MKAIENFEKETGVKLFELLSMLGNGAGIDNRICILIWYALEQGYKLAQKEIPFTREAVEAMDLDVMMDFVAVLTASIEKMGDSEKKRLAAAANKKAANI